MRAPSSGDDTLAPLIVAGAARPRDQRDLMERPFFSLAKSRRAAPIRYQAGDVEVWVQGLPEFGMATIWDADVLIWAGSQIVEAADLGRATSRRLRFLPYQLLTAIGRATGATEYRLLKAALRRLQSTVVATTLRNGEHWRRHQFSWINEWTEIVGPGGRTAGLEIVLPDWFYRGVLDRSLVLSIDPAYFQLTGGIERWLYRVARKHAGRQLAGWRFDVAHLHAKSGSLARRSDFALDLRRLVARQSLPGYRLLMEREGKRELLRILPSRVTLDLPAAVDGLVTSGARPLVISGVPASGDQAQDPQLTLWPNAENGPRNSDSNLESNLEGPPRRPGR
ncbi:MAG: replication initiator protein A [Caulobacter sp.]|nr:replication initiator protein A [Caulobacter sp.]